MVPFLGCSWLLLPPCLPSLPPFMISLLAAAALSPKLVCLHDSPSALLLAAAAALSPQLVSLHDLLGCSWMLVTPCLPSFSPFMISFLGSSWLPPSKLVSLHDLLGCSWLLVTPCLPSFFGLLLAAAAALSPTLSLSPVSLWAALGCRRHLVSQLVSLPRLLLVTAAAVVSQACLPS